MRRLASPPQLITVFQFLTLHLFPVEPGRGGDGIIVNPERVAAFPYNAVFAVNAYAPSHLEEPVHSGRRRMWRMVANRLPLLVRHKVRAAIVQRLRRAAVSGNA